MWHSRDSANGLETDYWQDRRCHRGGALLWRRTTEYATATRTVAKEETIPLDGGRGEVKERGDDCDGCAEDDNRPNRSSVSN